MASTRPRDWGASLIRRRCCEGMNRSFPIAHRAIKAIAAGRLAGARNKPMNAMLNMPSPVANERFADRSDEHTSELQSQMRESYADLCLEKKNKCQPSTPSKKK